MNGEILRPLVGVTASRASDRAHPSHRCGEKYLQAVVDPAGCAPVILPALNAADLVADWAGRLDGVLLTGGAANVEPARYGRPPSLAGTLHDLARDAMVLPLIRVCVERGVPLLGLCLGMQEMNVAFGGSLDQRLCDRDGFDHRMRRPVPGEGPGEEPGEPGPETEEEHMRRYRPAHDVEIVAGGLLDHILAPIKEPGRILVNSLHAQGIDRPGSGIRIEARAPDGVIEAISLADAPGFALGLQWHAEWPRPLALHDQLLFEAFGDACRAYAASRAAP